MVCYSFKDASREVFKTNKIHVLILMCIIENWIVYLNFFASLANKK
jgi:hypothetical protein